MWSAVMVGVVSVIVLGASCAAPTRPEPLALDDQFSSYEPGTGDEPELTIHAIVGNESCYTNHDLLVDETPDTVVVELIAHRRTDVRFCQAEGVFFERTVALTAPVEGRAVSDATTGAPISLREPR